jgi:hypothetical protein
MMASDWNNFLNVLASGGIGRQAYCRPSYLQLAVKGFIQLGQG